MANGIPTRGMGRKAGSIVAFGMTRRSLVVIIGGARVIMRVCFNIATKLRVHG